MKNKPTFEKVNPEFGNSILVRQHTESCPNNLAYWHFHPEIELVYVNKGRGKRHIGNHISYFNNSQLILIGSNLPHTGFTDRLTSNGKETLVQFRPEVLGDMLQNMPEMTHISKLFELAKKGLLYKPETKKLVGPKIEALVGVHGMARIIKILDILSDLSQAEDYTILNADGYAFEAKSEDSDRINIIYRHINQNFKRQIPLDEIADKVSMTVPAFCRYFKKATGKTFTQLVNEIRIVHATKLLSESKSSVTDICFECGFNNFSHFNKQFNEFTGKSASAYRKEIKLIIQS
ncbi:MAG: helix-turn-helix transcriptional regulator [Flavobacteriaceae bacterium]|nr:helix-turn-helix transcriptional regulator [Flavobacteriaceae bacterium]